MNGNRAVLDSNFLIFLSKGLINREALRSKYDKLYVSIITYIEVYAYDFVDKTQNQSLDEVFNNLEIIEINSDVADQTIIYRKNKPKKIKLPDAVILATTKIINADLITDNYRDFQNIDSSVNVLNLDRFKY
jgi:predicted nucleic acid-binding protein